ncbi:MAG: tetratricopeptide repeat protein [Burkholderiales bacterium]
MMFSIDRTEPAAGQGGPSARGGVREHLFAVVLLLVALALIYGRTGGFDYVYYDDVDYVTGPVRAGLSLEGVRWAFTAFYKTNWHPLTWISHMIDVSLFGLRPGPAHLVNVAFHGANSLLVYVLALALLRNWRASLLVAYLFLAHPLHVESVAWIAERKDVLCGMFFLLSILAYLRYATQPGARRYALLVFAFVLALLSKPMAVTLPLVLLLLDYWPLARLRSGPALILGRRLPAYALLFAEKVPLFALSLASSIVTLAAQKSAIAPLDAEPLSYRLMSSAVAYATYLRDTIVPTRLAILYPLTHQLGFLDSILPSVLLLALISGVVVYYRNRYPWLLFGWLWFVLTLLPVIGLVQVGSQSHADRYMYLPSIGLFLALGAAVARLSDTMSKRVLFAFAPVLVFYSFLAWIQVGYWSGSYMLYTRSLDVVGESLQARGGLAGFYLRIGWLQEAEAEAVKGVALSAGSPSAYLAYGILAAVLETKKDYAGAERAYRMALRIAPGNAPLLNNLGTVLERQGRIKEARQYFAAALKADPYLHEAKVNLKRVGG